MRHCSAQQEKLEGAADQEQQHFKGMMRIVYAQKHSCISLAFSVPALHMALLCPAAPAPAPAPAHLSHISLSHTTRPPAPSKNLAQHPLALGRSPPWVWESAEPLRPSVRTTLRQEPARTCTLRNSLRHHSQKMWSRRTEPAAYSQPRPAASGTPHPWLYLSMRKDQCLGGRR